MEKESSLKIKIDKYINGELSSEELAVFEDDLKTDKVLKANVDLQKEMHTLLLENKGYKKKDAEIGDFMNQMAEEFIVKGTTAQVKIVELNLERVGELDNKNAKKTLIKWLLPAATLAAAAILLFTFFPFGNSGYPTYADNNYTVYPASFATKGEVDDLTKASHFYESENWTDALNIFAKHPNNYKAQLAKGNCEYQLRQFDAAIASFKKVADSNSEYAESAAWYTALSYLQKENKEEAMVYLKKLSKQSTYYQQARQLLKKLN